MLRSKGLAGSLAALVCIGGVVASSVGPASSATPGLGDWSAYEHGVRHSSAAVGTAAITSGNAGTLHAVWHWAPPAGIIEASPTVVAGLVYIGTGNGRFFALNPATRRVVWSRSLDVGTTSQCSGKGIEATATVAPDPVTGTRTVYVEGARYLYALNAATGALVWKHIVGPAGTSANANYYDWSSPTVAGGHIYVGLSSRCDKPLIRGGEVEYNQHTGSVLHTYYTMPSGHTGGSIWSSAAYADGALWVTTGNPDSRGTFDSYSIVKLNPATLARQDKWTVPDLTVASDDDFGSSPVPFTSSGGQALISACNKNGRLYAWRETSLSAGPVWSDAVDDTTNGACLTSPAWDVSRGTLYAAAPGTSIGGASVPGAVRAVSADDGRYQWQTALPCGPLGSPTLDEPGHVLAVPLYRCRSGVAPVVELLDSTDGTVLGSVPAPGGAFSQPVFAGNYLYVASTTGGLTVYAA